MRSLALNGVGFGALALAVQGFTFIAVELPVDEGFAQPKWFNNLVPIEHKRVKVAAYIKLPSTTVFAKTELPEAVAGARLALGTTVVTSNNSEVLASAGTKVALVGIKSSSKLATILATGKHDLSDEELTAMVLELLNV